MSFTIYHDDMCLLPSFTPFQSGFFLVFQTQHNTGVLHTLYCCPTSDTLNTKGSTIGGPSGPNGTHEPRPDRNAVGIRGRSRQPSNCLPCAVPPPPTLVFLATSVARPSPATFYPPSESYRFPQAPGAPSPKATQPSTMHSRSAPNCVVTLRVPSEESLPAPGLKVHFCPATTRADTPGDERRTLRSRSPEPLKLKPRSLKLPVGLPKALRSLQLFKS
ncbi:hypothetical protein BD413DRAFT_291745 [Trametes elegans]|nr:hypothetical protein BD413DRAFT_291745 [Trametes elegans]